MPSNLPSPDGDPVPAPEPLHELTLGRRASPPPASSRPHDPAAAHPDLDALADRCRLKAEAARWAADCQRRSAGPAPTDPALAAWAGRLSDGFYWSNARGDAIPDLAPLDDAGGSFEALAEALTLAAHEGRGGLIARALPLLAEAQSAARQALRRLGMADDPDQVMAYEWVRDAAARYRLYLKRHMRADDPADPCRWPDLLARIAARAGVDRPAPHPPAPARLRPPEEATRGEDWTAEVSEARRLLGGRGVVLIGGSCRPAAAAALRAALGTDDLTWIETKEHQSVASFASAIARPEVALVLLAIRWSSHSFGEVKRFCDRLGKPLVRLPGGYGPNQVAAQILAQCSHQLGAE